MAVLKKIPEKENIFMKKILVITSMQNDFIEGPLATKEAAGIVRNVVSKTRSFKGRIFVILDTHYSNYPGTSEDRKHPVPHCTRLTNGWLVNGDVMAALSGRDFKSIEKQGPGSPKLIHEISKVIGRDKAEIGFCGLHTDASVISNALMAKAFFPETEITVDVSCCAGTTPGNHDAAVKVMKSCHVNVEGE